jgi:hypothetical protein
MHTHIYTCIRPSMHKYIHIYLHIIAEFLSSKIYVWPLSNFYLFAEFLIYILTCLPDFIDLSYIVKITLEFFVSQVIDSILFESARELLYCFLFYHSFFLSFFLFFFYSCTSVLEIPIAVFRDTKSFLSHSHSDNYFILLSSLPFSFQCAGLFSFSVCSPIIMCSCMQFMFLSGLLL